MHANFEISSQIELKRFKRKLNEKLKRKKRRKRTHKIRILHKANKIKAESELGGNFNLEHVISTWMPETIMELIGNEKSQFFADKLLDAFNKSKGKHIVPEHFSIVQNPKESYQLIKGVFGALIFQRQEEVLIDYSNCKEIDLGAQLLLDIIQKDILKFYRLCRRHPKTLPKVKKIGGRNVFEEKVQKMLFSVGTPAIDKNKPIYFDDIIPYPLCIHDREKEGDPIKIEQQKEIDTTELVDYVLECLERMGRFLTPEKIEDLSIVIGEILINAEEHSSSKKRYSIGYFHENNETGNHFGIFRLAILNFGETIYQKFKSPECPNKEIVREMEKLSAEYTRRNFFLFRDFEEETLWTLYSLQEGVTSVPKSKYKKRGHGSIQFIEKFFNIQESKEVDKVSKMAILSGNTSIVFDGKYAITEGVNSQGEKCKYMTFNNSGRINDKPDKEYVKFVEQDFPGTIISAKILFNHDDFSNEIK
ncbi:MAG: hypothetical protein VXW38_02950 [Bacteroidota bacterium]|nr:hypothetical protein [Bacteroidota bacterium]